MDLCDDPKNTHITAMLEVPGMKPEQLSVRIEGGRLIIQGERKGPHLHLGGQTAPAATHPPPSEPTENASAADEASTLSSLYPVRELKYGKFKRVIDLPAGVNVSLSSCLNVPRRRWLTFFAGNRYPQLPRGGHADHLLAARPHLARRGRQPRRTRHPASRQSHERKRLSHDSSA